MSKPERLKRLLRPKTVAWFGGGGMAPAIDYMRANGFDGEAVAVHPTRQEIAGLRCVPSIDALPFLPDLAVLVIPKEAVEETVRALSEKECGDVICMTSGFSESADGGARQTALIEAAGEMPVIGPNCPGIANFLDGAAFMMDHFGTHDPTCGVAVISNGGAYLSDLGCADRSQPIACLIGLGNQAMIGVADLLDVVLDDQRVTAVNIYFEGIADAVALSRAAAKAAAKGVPVVAIKGGRSEAGTRAARSHTASLAGDAAIASALFRRFGWIEVETPSEAIETLKMLSFTSLPRGVKAGFVTSSGSYAVLGGDLAETLGLEMPRPSKAVAPLLDNALPAYVSSANPLDISDAHGWAQEDQVPIYEAFARDPYDLFIQVMCYPPEGGWDISTWEATTGALAEVKGDRPAAFVNTLAEALPKSTRTRMIASGVAPLQGLEDGLRAVAHVARYGLEQQDSDPSAMVLDSELRPELGRACRTSLDEATAKQRLASAGLTVPRQWIVTDLETLPELPSHVALKALIPGLLHKSDVGAVALNLQPEEMPTAIHAMSDHLRRQGLHPERFLIEEMIHAPVAELLVGLRRVPGIGSVLTMAVGGTAVELMDDSATLLLPSQRSEIEVALRRLKLAPLLFGYRGRSSVDPDVTLDAIEALCAVVRSDPDIAELEINPLMLTETRAIIADAALTLRG